MARQGQAVIAETKECLWAELDHAMQQPGDFHTVPRPSGSSEAALRLGRAVQEMQSRPARIVSMKRLGQLLVSCA
ncbi:hypothetical protein J2808_001634 [Pseudarthrobacter sulfonivorans]|nr:hypothetical protein [Pseudarthrobacter sulfonivorans]